MTARNCWWTTTSQAGAGAVEELNASGTRHIQALQWALKAKQQAKNWPEVLRLVRSLDKRNALHPALSNRLRELAYDALLSDARMTPNRSACSGMAYPVPTSSSRTSPCAPPCLRSRGLHDEARSLRSALAADWDTACCAPTANRPPKPVRRPCSRRSSIARLAGQARPTPSWR
jgi:HemY protein